MSWHRKLTHLVASDCSLNNRLQNIDDFNLLKLYADVMNELRDRELIRSSNNPVADYAEKVAVEHLGLTRVGKEERGFDAIDDKKKKYQIKGRRITKHNNSRQLGVIRNLDEHLFDNLIAVIFNEEFCPLEIWKIPYWFVKQHSRWSRHQNGHIFIARKDILRLSKSIKRLL